MAKRSAEEAFEDDTKEPIVEKPIKVNSLDSDEEDEGDGDGENYQILEEDDIEGQEEGAVGREGDIQLTPFNMKEELEEGHFDTDGMYHWNKEKVVKDNWLENIDWIKIKEVKESNSEENEDSEFLKPTFNDIEAYKKLITLMKPGESVAKSMRRLGGNKPVSSSERWKKKKNSNDETTSSEIDNNKIILNQMTELASNILTHTGNMDIYQETYEYILNKLETNEKSKKKITDDLDMYADDFDVKEKRKLTDENPTPDNILMKPPETKSSESIKDSDSTSTSVEEEKQLQWEYKWKKEDENIEGPFTSEQMQNWTQIGKFKDEIWVRKVGTNGEFYTNKRIDFELYM